MAVTFDTIPTTRIPGRYVELNTKATARGLPGGGGKVCLIGQMTSGTATAEELTTVTSVEDAVTLFGRGSMLHRMVLAALTAERRMSVLYALPLADAGSGVAAAGSIAVAISSLTAGTLTLWLGGDVMTLAIAAADTANGIAAAIKALLDDYPDLPVSATVSTNTVTITAKNDGTLGNAIEMETEYSGTGLTLTLTQLTSGATDVDIQDALDAIYTADVDIIVSPYNTSTPLGTLSDHLEGRSNGVEQRGAVGVSASIAGSSTLATLGAAVNDGRIMVVGMEGSTHWPPEVAAAAAAVLAGEEDLARPLNGLALKGIRPPPSSYRWTRGELTTLLANGIAPLSVSSSEEVTIVRSVSTYVTNGVGAPDDTLLDLQTIRVLDYVRKAIRTRLDLRFSRVKIADVAHTETTTDPKKIRAEILDVLFACEEIDYLENVDANKDDVVVERNSADPTRVDCHLPADIVNGLHVLAARIDLIL